MIYTVYDPATGKIYSTTQASDGQTPPAPEGFALLPGEFSGKKYQVVNGSAQALPEDPSDSRLKYLFDPATQQYQIDVAMSTVMSRQHRNGLLAAVDRVNPVWYASLTSQQQSELAQYRQCLLDVPQQPGWPESVSWPRQPAWL